MLMMHRRITIHILCYTYTDAIYIYIYILYHTVIYIYIYSIPSISSIPQQTMLISTESSPCLAGHAVYLGNTCPWCHRVALALAFRQVPERCVARVQCLGCLGCGATFGGWVFLEVKHGGNLWESLGILFGKGLHKYGKSQFCMGK